jgi:branched-chain amino acid transport system permease protein
MATLIKSQRAIRPRQRQRGHSWFRVRHEHRVEVAAGIAAVLIGGVVPFALGDAYWQQVVLLMDLYAAAAVFLNILRGEAGQISFGMSAVFGAAAYTVGMAVALYGIPFWPAMLIGIGVGFVFGIVTALPALRVQGYYLGFITLAVAVVLPAMLLNYNEFTHAVSGLSVTVPGIYTTTLWGLNWVSITIIALAGLSFLVHAWVRASTFGRHLRTAAASPEAAASLGLRPGLLRLAAFGLAGLGTALCGALYIPATGFVSPGAFPFTLSILLYFAVIVGGAGSIVGPLLGISLLYLVPNVLLSNLAQYRLLIYGCAAFVVMLVFPDGVIGFLRTRFSPTRHVDPDLSDQLAAAMLAQRTESRPTGHPRASDEPVLVISQAVKHFGSVRALDGVDLNLRHGEIHGLVGANGSGKTTLLNAISGLITLDRGNVAIASRDITRMSPTRRAAAGLGRTFQTPRVFEEMSLYENLNLDQREDTLDTNQRDRWDRTSAQSLTHAQRRLTELYRVLMRRPTVLLLDEPAAGLSASERDELGQVLRRLASTGVTVLLVEHDLALVWTVAHTVSVMELGAIVRTDTPAALASDQAIDALLGGGFDAHR